MGVSEGFSGHRGTPSVDVAIVGAGPYGLSVGATLRAARVSCHVFGRPMQTWRTAMPVGMQLKSDGFATNLYVPLPDSTLADFCRRRSIPYDDERVLIDLATFIDYGLDFQSRFVPHLDELDVVSVTRRGDGFLLDLEDGTQVAARHVVLAVGITHFAQIPEVLDCLPPGRITHSSDHTDVSMFAGKDVTVIGRGASAVELAVLLHEAGARPRLLVRGSEVRFNDPPTPGNRSVWQRIRHPKSGLGPGLTSWLCCTFPQSYRRLPGSLRMRILTNHLGPKSLHHLRERVEGKIPVLLRHRLERCSVDNDRLELHCRDEAGNLSTIRTDHVIAATGYAARVDRLRFIAPDLRAAIATHEGYPILSADFESSVPGLYFVGLASAGTFGPMMRFVYGAAYAARRLVGRFAA